MQENQMSEIENIGVEEVSPSFLYTFSVQSKTHFRTNANMVMPPIVCQNL